MIGETIARALPGITLIEDESGAVARILAEQIARAAAASGARVRRLPLNGTADALADELFRMTHQQKGDADAPRRSTQKGDGEVLVIDSFSTAIFGLPDEEKIRLIGRITSASAHGTSFLLTSDGRTLDARINAYLKAISDNVIILRVELVGEKVARTLYIQKLKNAVPSDKLLKFTVDEQGVQIDTRELIG